MAATRAIIDLFPHIPHILSFLSVKVLGAIKIEAFPLLFV